jgi:hypothetical protein
MNLLKKLISAFYDFFENIKGSRTLIPINVINDPNHKYTFQLTDNTNITIHCDETRYLLTYKSPWVKNKIVSIYKVYSVITNSSTDNVKNKFENKELYISNLWHFYANTESQKKAAINAFVDLIYHDTIRDNK